MRGNSIGVATIDSDIDFMHDMPQGSYFSLLYDTTEEFMGIVASFLEAGLQNNELCVWAVSGQVAEEEVRNFLRGRGVDVEKYLESGQLMITPCTECYFSGEELLPKSGPSTWESIYEDAMSRGYDGLRMTDKFTIAGEESWKSFTGFARKGMEMIRGKHIVALFAFLKEARTGQELLEIIEMHDGTVIMRDGRWTLLQSSSYCKPLLKEKTFPEDMLENIWTGVWAVDRNDNIVYFNKGMESISGLSKTEVLGQKLVQFIPRQFNEEELSFAELFQIAKDSLQSKSYDVFPFIKPDGQFIYHSGVMLPLINEDGTYGGMLGTIGNVFEQKISQKTLRDKFRSIEKLEDIYRKSPVVAVLWRAEKDWPIEFISENIAQFGYVPEDFTSGRLVYRNIIHPDDLEFVQTSVEQLEIEEKFYFSKDYRLMTRTGEVRWVTERSYLIRDENGKPAYYQGIIIDITDRRKAEEAVLEAEKKYRLIFENSPLGIFHFNKKGILTHCNEKFLQIMGLEKKEDIIGFNLVASIVDKRMKKAVNDVFSRKVGHFEGEYHTVSTNITINIKADYSPNIAEDGTFLGGIGVFEDISERKMAEEAALEAEKKYRHIFENSPIGIFHFNDRGIVTHCNEKFLEIIGLKNKEEIIGFNMVTRIKDKMMKKAIRDVLSRKEGHFEGNYHTVISGKDTYIKADYSLNVADDGTFLGGIGIFEDISGRKKAEEALRLDESRLETLLKLNQMTNKTFKEMADFVQEEAVKLTQSKMGYLAFLDDTETVLSIYSWSKDVMTECNVEKGEKKFDYLLESTGLWGEPVRQKRPIIVNDYENYYEFKHGYPKGHIQMERYMSVPIIEDGRVVGVAGVGNKKDSYNQADVRQLTLLMEGMWQMMEQKKAEDTLRRFASELAQVNKELSKANAELSTANEELKSLDRMKDEFLSNVSHEFKTPLTSIQGYSQLISDGTLGSVNDQQKKAVDTVIRNSERLRKLVDSLLYISRAQAGKLTYSFSMVPITSIIDNSIQDLALQAEKKDITFEKNLGEDLPLIRGDRDKLVDVIVNLLDNAIKFTPTGGKVEVGALVDNDKIHVYVSDSGIGIPTDKIPNLFGRFYQVDSSIKRRYGGTGLGLYICKMIVEDHKGKIWVESEEGKGSTFHVLLPLE